MQHLPAVGIGGLPAAQYQIELADFSYRRHQGAADSRTICDHAANERLGESSRGSSIAIGLAGSPAQVTVLSCSWRNHMR